MGIKPFIGFALGIAFGASAGYYYARNEETLLDVSSALMQTLANVGKAQRSHAQQSSQAAQPNSQAA